ncbi:MAG TPA: nuclear transport factor 2 family protein [Solirubrobacterales bacterium]|nr:nuclear transport factor 2 family protein [Solirubrobacterales bacterium]
MTQDPVEVIREQYAATNERDFERAMDVYADDVVLVVGEGWGITSGRFEGKAAVGEWFGDWFRQFAPGYHFEIVELRELGGGVVFLDAKHGGSGRASGVTIGSESGYLYRVVNGKIVQVQLFSTPAEALEAASLPEWSGSENG